MAEYEEEGCGEGARGGTTKHRLTIKVIIPMS